MIALALLLAFVSGACALVYESLWLRALALVFGNSVPAGATVIAAFMGGLAFGGALGGRMLGRVRLPALRVYALLELVIAGSALLLPLAWDALEPLSRRLYGSSGGGLTLSFARLLLSLLLLLAPTACMGASFPALARALAPDRARAPQRLGLIYAVNTAGGIVGALLAGFWLIPRLGIVGANALAVLASVAVAAGAWWLGGREPVSGASGGATQRGETPPAAATLALPAALAAGFAALAFEVLAFRVLLLVFGSTTYAFTIMLAAYLGGIALGSALARPWLLRPSPLALGLALGLGGLGLVAVVASVDGLPWLYLAALRQFGLSWRGDLAARSAVAAAFLLPPTLAFGAAFALALREQVGAAGAPVERAAGQLYAANSVGAILGSLAGGFLLLPALGLQASLVALATGLLACGSFLLARRRTPPAWRAAAALALVAAALAPRALRPWDQKLLAQGVYMTPRAFFDANGGIALERVIADQRLLHSREGITSTVAILEGEGIVTSLRVDGKVEMSDLPADRRLGRMMGHLPMLLHGSARKALTVGLGAGLTVAGVAAHPAERIDVVELEPAMVEAARLLGSLNRGVVDDPRVKQISGDGRNHLRLSSERYDVITSDPFEPTVSGAASLFTREAFAQARARLAPHGLACQWVPLYELGPAELDSIFGAFAATFPSVSVWFTGRDTLLIGSEQEVRIDVARLGERMSAPRVRRDLEDAGLLTPARLLATFVAELEGGPPTDAAAPINSDSFPYIEFQTPKRRWQPTMPANLHHLLRMRRAAPPPVTGASPEQEQEIARAYAAHTSAMLALFEQERGATDAARRQASRALELEPGQPLAASVLVRAEVAAALDTGDLARGVRALALDPEASLQRIQLADALVARERLDEAAPLVNAVLERHPRSLGARLVLVEIQRERGLLAEAGRTLQGLAADFPESPRVRHAAAALRDRP